MGNSVFPTLPGLAWGTQVTPSFSTAVKRAVSGRELRVAYAAYPLWKISLSFEFLRDGNRGADLDTLVGMFLQVKGQYDSFLFTLPTDNSVTSQNFGTGDGVTTAFQLRRSFGQGGFSFQEPVQNLNGNPSIYKNGVLQTLGSNYTIDSNGLVTFSVAPGNALPLTWTGSYYYRCRFLQDVADFQLFMQDLYELKKLEMIGAPGNRV
jgi:uncharacterized protein (TIGR02217 family)